MKLRHEIRDPIHNFVRISDAERKIVATRPVQRLRHVHQLALSSLVYPGATHRRFEHSLGVMELAGRIFDVVTEETNLREEVRDRYPELLRADAREGLRTSIRLAALLHDVGHLPFSHAAEHELLPEGINHEVLTMNLIDHGDLKEALEHFEPVQRPSRLQQLSVGPKKFPGPVPALESLLCDIIVGDAFGADRMDYLLRDSYHAGVAYGRFDHFRLIDTIRFLPNPENPDEILMGVEYGGLQSAEAMALARYFMYSQVYMHQVRRIYDIHLKDYLQDSLEGGRFSVDSQTHLEMTDNEVFASMHLAAYDPGRPGHVHAKRILCREHFKVVFEQRLRVDEPGTAKKVSEYLVGEFGPDAVRLDDYPPKPASVNFPVVHSNDELSSSLSESDTLLNVPNAAFARVYIDRQHFKAAKDAISKNFSRKTH